MNLEKSLDQTEVDDSKHIAVCVALSISTENTEEICTCMPV